MDSLGGIDSLAITRTPRLNKWALPPAARKASNRLLYGLHDADEQPTVDRMAPVRRLAIGAAQAILCVPAACSRYS